MTTTQPPLDQPLYGATLPQAVGRFFRKYATFSGRASRSEFWWVYLFLVIVFAVLGFAFGVLGTVTRSAADAAANQPGPGAAVIAVPLVLFGLAVIVPAIALHVRRLHDANLSGLLYLITFVPYLGGFVLLILAILPTSPAGARFDAGAAPTVAATPYPAPGYTPAPPAPTAPAGYTPAPPAPPVPPVQAGPPPQASPPPVAPPADPPTT
jgi:uncharacterized membrane protein YhaH (DUF805 family)